MSNNMEIPLPPPPPPPPADPKALAKVPGLPVPKGRSLEDACKGLQAQREQKKPKAPPSYKKLKLSIKDKVKSLEVDKKISFNLDLSGVINSKHFSTVATLKGLKDDVLAPETREKMIYDYYKIIDDNIEKCIKFLLDNLSDEFIQTSIASSVKPIFANSLKNYLKDLDEEYSKTIEAAKEAQRKAFKNAIKEAFNKMKMKRDAHKK